MTYRLAALGRSRRTLLVSAALGCFAAAFVLTPSDVRSQLDGRQGAVRSVPVVLPQAPLLAVAPAGDAFAPRADSDDEPLPTVAAVPRAILLPRLPGPESAVSSAPPDTRVTAIATGAKPTAVVESGGSARIVGIGDPLDGSIVTGIDAGAIRLASGKHLALVSAEPAP